MEWQRKRFKYAHMQAKIFLFRMNNFRIKNKISTTRRHRKCGNTLPAKLAHFIQISKQFGLFRFANTNSNEHLIITADRVGSAQCSATPRKDGSYMLIYPQIPIQWISSVHTHTPVLSITNRMNIIFEKKNKHPECLFIWVIYESR